MFTSSNKMGFTPVGALVITLLVVLVGGVIVWQFWPRVSSPISSPTATPNSSLPLDKTADRKVYRNNEYGFEFEYPKDWIIVESVSPEYPYFLVVNIGHKKEIQEGGLFGVTLRDQTEGEYLSAIQKEFIIDSNSKITLGKRPATMYSFYRSRDPETKWRTIIIPLNDLLLEFSNGATTDYNEIFDQILSTFKFIS